MESSVDSYINAQPEEVMDFNSFFNKTTGLSGNPNNFWYKIGNAFSGTTDAAKKEYEAYLTNVNNRNEFLAQQSARAWDKMMDDTKIQRQMKDLEAAGLNPYLTLNNGSITATSAPSSSKASYQAKQEAEKQSNAGRNIALLLLAVAKVAAAFL